MYINYIDSCNDLFVILNQESVNVTEKTNRTLLNKFEQLLSRAVDIIKLFA